MSSIIEKNKRAIIVLSLLLFWGIGGLNMMDFNVEFTGGLFLLAFLLSAFYFPLAWWLRRRERINPTAWGKVERPVISLLLIVPCFIGIIESHPRHIGLALVLAQVLAFTLVFSYLHYRYRKGLRRGESLRQQLGNLKYAYWTVGASSTALLFVLTLYESEPLAELAALFYFGGLFVLWVGWLIRQAKLIIRLKSEKAKTELVHLQSQVNPHFFFNMLNNLYGLVKQDSEKAQQLILKLSDMMRYSIYQGQQDRVPLKAEIAYLQNFIALHQMRYQKKIEVKFNLHVQEEDHQVLPLIFVILLENAFKHGVEKLRNNAYIHINLIAGGNDVTFAIENNFDVSELVEEPGIGLQNLRRRLELVYPNKHSLSFAETGDVFKAQLSLQLK